MPSGQSQVKSESTRHHWVAKDIKLKFEIGEIVLFSRRYSALVLDVGLSVSQDKKENIGAPIEKLGKQVQSLFVRSFPLEQNWQQLRLMPEAIRYTPTRYHRFYIDLTGSFKDYLGKFSSKSRSTIARKVRRFAEHSGGSICWREYHQRADMKEFLNLARQISRKTYQERLLHSGIPTGDEFTETTCDQAAKGMVRGYVLFLEQRPIAYLFCPVVDDTLLYRYLGYDPDFRRWSPGTVLQYLVLERLFHEGQYRFFDFTQGDGAHKEFFATGSVPCVDICYLPRNASSFLLVATHIGMSYLSSGVAKTLDAIGLKSQIKRFFRSNA